MSKLIIRLTSILLIWTVAPLNAQQIDASLFDALKPRNIGPVGMSGRVTAIDAVVANPNII